MTNLWQDVRFGLRMLIKNPGFALVTIITIALGIGANAAIFSVINGVLLRPLPYPEPERLVAMRSNMSVLNLEDFRARTQSFEEGGGAVLQPLDYTGGAEPVQVQAALSTAGLFKVLGARAALGRVISPEEDRVGAERVVVLSYGFWQQQFGGDKNIIGRTIPLSGGEYTVVGVMAPDFVLPHGKPDVFTSVRVTNPVASAARGAHFLRNYWRLKPGVTIAQAQGEMAAIEKELEQLDPVENKNRRIVPVPLHERVVGDTRPALLILFGAVGLVLLIACANFANLLLARSASRQQEILIRTALGAGRMRLVTQLLTESVMLSILGGAVGLVFAMWGVDLLMSFQPESLPRLDSIGLDGRVLLFTLGVSVLTGLVFGLVPAWNASRANVSEALKEGGRASTSGVSRHRFSNLLVVSELALAIVLLIGAGLLIKGFWRLSQVESGFNPDGLVSMRIELPEARYKDIATQTQFRERVLQSVGSLPGAEAAMISEIPLVGESLFQNFVIEGQPVLAPGEEPELHTRTVMGDYFRLMSIPLLKGRALSSQDRDGSMLVAVINEAMAREFFKDKEPLGARLRWARGEQQQWVTIVGVVGDVHHFGLNQPDEPAVYTPYAQTAFAWKRWQYLVVRSNAQSPASLVESVKKQVWSIDSQLPLTKVRTLREVVAKSMTPQRFYMTLLGIFAGVALLLACVGIYGVISYSVTQRTHEIGIRMALGASARDVLGMVLRQGMLLTVAGVAIGLLASFALTRLMAAMLFGVTATDPLTFVSVSAILAAVALLSCYLPARRATRVDPMVALRYE
ncbi:MAG TPA: ABC transporter permease [Pyrinomonadaceae bacterium]|nr:ABC transporter permease [Pyrinomonadaceae bacterium]